MSGKWASILVFLALFFFTVALGAVFFMGH